MTRFDRLMTTLRCALILCGLLLAAPAAAQLSFEVRGGGAVGNHLPAAAGLQTSPGLSLAAAAELRVLPYLSLGVDYSHASFACAGGFCEGREVRVSTSGVGGGLRLHPSRLPWTRAGVRYYGASVHPRGEPDSQVDPALGFELGAGFTIPIAARARLLPGIHLRSQLGDDRTTLVGAELGFQLSLR